MEPDEVKAICAEYKIHNCDIIFREDCTADQLIDVIEGNRSVIRAPHAPAPPCQQARSPLRPTMAPLLCLGSTCRASTASTRSTRFPSRYVPDAAPLGHPGWRSRMARGAGLAEKPMGSGPCRGPPQSLTLTVSLFARPVTTMCSGAGPLATRAAHLPHLGTPRVEL